MTNYHINKETKQVIEYVTNQEPNTWESGLFMAGFNRSYTRKMLTEVLEGDMVNDFFEYPRKALEGLDLKKVNWYQVARSVLKANPDTVKLLMDAAR